jgi:hypothetical protein
MPSRPQDDPEAHRLRERGQEQDRRSFEDTGLAFFALCALARYRPGEQLPLWVHRWLLDFTREVLPAYLYRPATTARPATATRRAKVDRPEHVPTLDGVREKVLNALGLGPQQGRKMIAKLQGYIIDDVLLTMLDCAYSADQLADRFGVQSRQIKARAHRARKHRPE